MIVTPEPVISPSRAYFNSTILSPSTATVKGTLAKYVTHPIPASVVFTPLRNSTLTLSLPISMSLITTLGQTTLSHTSFNPPILPTLSLKKFSSS
jgi:hypothetical protein